MIELILALYLSTVLSIGWASHRLLKRTGEDYFLAGRSIGPFVLLMSLFGTHMTSFAILGASSESYRSGVGVFALMASSSALVVPLLFLFLGTRTWSVGKRNGFMTQVEFFRERWESEGAAVLIFLALTLLLLPYVLIGVMGGGITVSQITEGRIPEWVGNLMVCTVVLLYVTVGGMRGTAWANTFQTLVFMVLGAVTFTIISQQLGGVSSALQRIGETSPQLLTVGDRFPPLKLLSYTLIPLSAGMFPHIHMHWLTARRRSAFRTPVIFYPLCIAIVWTPTVLLGVLARLDFPDLEGPAVGTVLVRLIAVQAPGALAGLLAAGVLAAVMSSLDSQVLAVGTMFTRDVLPRVIHRGLSETRQVVFGRLFIVILLAAAFVLAQFVNRGIFSLGVWTFSGFTGLLPLTVAALYWKRSTWLGAVACVLTTSVLWGYFLLQGWGNPDYSIGSSGLMPVAVILGASGAALVLASLVSRPPSRAALLKFFPDPDGKGIDRGN